MWRMGASGLTTPVRRGLFANLHLLATPPTPVFAKISIASTEFPIRSVREILPSGLPVAIRHRAVNPTNFELLLTTPSVMSVTATSTPVIAKLFTFRKDMYATELAALRQRRAALREHMVLVRTRLTANAAEEALERQMQALYRVLEALRGERMPLDLLLATKDLYRGVSRVLVGEVQQMQPRVRLAPNMMNFEAFKAVLDKKPVVVRDLDVLVGKMEKFFLGF
ncbi:hypothetical protein BCR44DRAFT_1436412 [Catenaria anguillulae PL171]|uniref:Uncharacterized protein n=1 Tax=Catenaria anguillulae PL171 TaxID=765915 RepID=A0A1Y2HKS6_9FUNG|nr:hypothetical protein BCR44DRAFT_1436412 [Catenaria anguillulae PL171]